LLIFLAIFNPFTLCFASLLIANLQADSLEEAEKEMGIHIPNNANYINYEYWLEWDHYYVRFDLPSHDFHSWFSKYEEQCETDWNEKHHPFRNDLNLNWWKPEEAKNSMGQTCGSTFSIFVDKTDSEVWKVYLRNF